MKKRKKLCLTCQMLYTVKKCFSKLSIKQILILYKVATCIFLLTFASVTKTYKK